jgi:hypothetical protein
MSERITQKAGSRRKRLSTKAIGLSDGPEDQQSYGYLLGFPLKH